MPKNPQNKFMSGFEVILISTYGVLMIIGIEVTYTQLCVVTFTARNKSWKKYANQCGLHI